MGTSANDKVRWEINVGWALETRVVVAKPLTEKRQISRIHTA